VGHEQCKPESHKRSWQVGESYNWEAPPDQSRRYGRLLDARIGDRFNDRNHDRSTLKMRQDLAHAEDDRLEEERRRTYLGTARIRIEALHFRRNGLREPDKKHVEHLKGRFSDGGCRPLEKQNHIKAKIRLEVLDAALKSSGIQQADLLSNQPQGYAELEIPPGWQVECLQGQHRILAASEVLEPSEQWWAVDLYRTGIVSPSP
jgi:hypothetical protein